MDANGIACPTIIQKTLNITWLSVYEEQMHSLLFHKAYQGHATEMSNKKTVAQTQHLFSTVIFILSNVFLNLDKSCAT